VLIVLLAASVGDLMTPDGSRSAFDDGRNVQARTASRKDCGVPATGGENDMGGT
jgi:hypothetical protein